MPRQVCIPRAVAMTLTYPERVTPHNIDKLRQRVSNGAHHRRAYCALLGWQAP